MTDSLSDLAQRLRDGDRTAFEQFVRDWQGFVYANAYAVTGNADDAREVAQEVFVNLYRKIDSLREPAALKSFLRTAARNRALDFVRRRRSCHVSLDSIGELEEPAGDNEPERGLFASEDNEMLRSSLREALAELPGDQQEVIRLRYERGYSYAEIAECIGEGDAVVRGRLYRAHKALAGRLAHLKGSGYER
jgi:RNA polymerase sigma-70 factor (ECF subfamily)